jgi:cell division protein FtsA
VLSQAEIDAGVALIDIGGGTTDICVFEDGSIRHTAIISIGGDRITKDLKEAFGILPEQAEIVKVNYGSCYPTESMKNEVVVVPGLPGRKHKEISRFAIAQVIQARMEDIIERINYEIEVSTMKNRLAGGIVLTGGGSSLANITQLVSYHTALEVHIGTPGQRLGKGMVDEVRNPMFATGIGLVLRGFESSARFDVPENTPIQRETSKPIAESPEVVVEAPKQPDNEKKDDGFFKRTWPGNFGGKFMDELKNWMKDGEDFSKES